MIPEESQQFEQIVRKVVPGGRLLRAWKLQGGVSAQVTALEVEHPEVCTQKMLVRRHGPVDLKRNPHIATDEYTLLQRLYAAGLPVPRPYAVDQSCEIFPTPYIVIEYIEGETEFAPSDLSDFLLQFATCLSKIHQVDTAKLDVSFLPAPTSRYNKLLHTWPASLDEASGEGRIRTALEAVGPLAQRNASALLHGDYWPGNLLWHSGRLVAVIDWEDSAFGDPLADLANSRLEILWAFGVEAMQHFTTLYQSLNTLDDSTLPHHDLYAALRPIGKMAEWAADAAAEQLMRERHRWFVAQALQQ